MHHDRRTSHPLDSWAGAETPVEATFVPHRYEPNYPYPLLVLLHGRGGDEHQLVRSMPTMSWRNYVGLGLRGPSALEHNGAPAGFDWGPEFRHPRRRPGPMRSGPEPSLGERISRELRGESSDVMDAIEDGLFSAVRRTRRTLHIHSERIFLVGCGEGAAVAYRLGLTYPERFAGVVAINGWIPSGFRPLSRWNACRDLRVLVAHGLWNARAPIQDVRHDVDLLRLAGLRVTFRAYDCAHRIGSTMLSDVDSWLIHQCTSARF